MANHQNNIHQIPGARTATSKNKIYKITGHPAFRSVVLVLLLAVIAFTAYITQPSNKQTSARTTTASAATKPNDNTHAASNTHASTSGNSTATSPKSSSGSTASSGSTSTTGPCSSVLTADQAKTVLGDNPAASTSNGTTSQATDMTIISCAYTVGVNTATVIEHKSNTPTGQHENDDQFGSSRPSGVTSVSGYGQVAYWQSSTGLNILQDNDWYVVSISNNGSISESSSEQLAKASPL
jgi:hypothetical protein